TVNAVPNAAPTATAGADQTITLPAGATLNGSATDDGLPNPPAALTYAWSMVSGPGTVTFGTPGAATTTASFSAAGSYTLRLTVSDSALSATDDVVVTVNAAATGTGLTGQYYNDTGATFFTTLALTRVDPTINFSWSRGSPGPGVLEDNFSVRWTGQVQAPVTGNVLFRTASDDGVRVWVNGVQIINNWTDHALTNNTSAAIPMVAGTRYDIRVEYYERTSAATIRLLWSYPGQTTYVAVPQSRLFP
ncbi:MAG: PA14 domain-containing protein, partial [Vicinamibacterales bacterium]